MRLFGEIRRVDEVQRMVWGYASTPNKAADGKTITLDAMRAAFDDYMAFANIREMHQLSAVGRAEEGESFVDDGGIYIGAKVVDDTAWNKVTEKVYRGFSIAAKITARDPNDKNSITGIKINEISLVDRPGDPGATFEVFRAAISNEENDMAEATETVERRTFTQDQRDKLAASGAAMKDGSYPIENRADLENAIRAFGRAKNKAAVKKHILKRAKALKAEDLIPDDWADNTAKRAAGADGEVAGEGDAEGDEEDEGGEPVARAGGDPAEPDDLVTRATRAALDAVAGANTAIGRVEAAVHPTDAAVIELPGAEIRRGLNMVSRLSYLLSELAYIAMDSQWEAEIEGDNSPVPGKLRSALLELAKAYKAMSDEELAELLKGVDVDVALENGVILLAATGADLERLNKAHGDVLTRRGFELPVPADAAIPNDELVRLSSAVETLTGERDTLLRSVGDLTGQMTEITRRLDKLAEEPVPAKTAANSLARAVSKEGDVAGNGAPEPASESQITGEGIQRYLASLSEEDRGLLLIRAAHTRPVAINR